MDQLVAGTGPGFAGHRIAQMMSHAGGARREDRQIGAALALHLELATLDRFTDLVVGDIRAPRRRLAGLVRLDLLAAPPLVLARGGRVVAVAINNHRNLPPSKQVVFPAKAGTQGAHKVVTLDPRFPRG